MKKMSLLIVAILFVLCSAKAQIGESEVRAFFSKNNYEVLNYTKGVPSCLEGREIYSSSMKTVGDEEATTFESPVHFFTIKDGTMNCELDVPGLTNKIISTVTLRNKTTTFDYIMFICENNYCYRLDILDITDPVLYNMNISYTDFDENTLTSSGDIYLTAITEETNDIRNFDFSIFKSSLECDDSGLSDEDVNEILSAYYLTITEDDIRKFFDKNDYEVLNYAEGIPECLNGYSIFTNSMKGDGEEVTKYDTFNVFSIKDGVMTCELDVPAMTNKILHTVSVKNKSTDLQSIMLLAEDGYCYRLELVDLSKPKLFNMNISLTLFSTDTYSNLIDVYVTKQDGESSDINKFDFSVFEKDLKCK